MNIERNIITINKYGKVTMPIDIRTTVMSERELCELLGIIATNIPCSSKGNPQERNFV